MSNTENIQLSGSIPLAGTILKRDRGPVTQGVFMKFIHLFITCIVGSILLAGCANRPSTDVKQILLSYQAGVTKFKEFKRDAGLIELSGQTNTPVQARSYRIPVTGPWKLYDREDSRTYINGKFMEKWMYAVGDTNAAISSLWFNSSGTLIEITAPELPSLFFKRLQNRHRLPQPTDRFLPGGTN